VHGARPGIPDVGHVRTCAVYEWVTDEMAAGLETYQTERIRDCVSQTGVFPVIDQSGLEDTNPESNRELCGSLSTPRAELPEQWSDPVHQNDFFYIKFVEMDVPVPQFYLTMEDIDVELPADLEGIEGIDSPPRAFADSGIGSTNYVPYCDASNNLVADCGWHVFSNAIYGSVELSRDGRNINLMQESLILNSRKVILSHPDLLCTGPDFDDLLRNGSILFTCEGLVDSTLRYYSSIRTQFVNELNQLVVSPVVSQWLDRAFAGSNQRMVFPDGQYERFQFRKTVFIFRGSAANLTENSNYDIFDDQGDSSERSGDANLEFSFPPAREYFSGQAVDKISFFGFSTSSRVGAFVTNQLLIADATLNWYAPLRIDLSIRSPRTFVRVSLVTDNNLPNELHRIGSGSSILSANSNGPLIIEGNLKVSFKVRLSPLRICIKDFSVPEYVDRRHVSDFFNWADALKRTGKFQDKLIDTVKAGILDAEGQFVEDPFVSGYMGRLNKVLKSLPVPEDVCIEA